MDERSKGILITFGNSAEPYYGKVIAVDPDFLYPYTVEIDIPIDRKGEIIKLHYDCINWANASYSPSDWECINEHIKYDYSMASVNGILVRLSDDRLFDNMAKEYRIIGHFIPKGSFMYSDSFTRARYMICQRCDSESGLRKSIGKHNKDIGRKEIDLRDLDYFSVYSQKLSGMEVQRRDMDI